MKIYKNEIIGVLIGFISIFLFSSFLTYNPIDSPGGLSDQIANNNIMGILGVYASYYLMKYTLGWAAFCFPLTLGLCSYIVFTRKNYNNYISYIIYLLCFSLWLSIMISFWGIVAKAWWEAEYGGIIGYVMANFLIDF